MWPAVVLLFCIACVGSVWLHIACVIKVGSTCCLVKYRKLRRGRAKFAAMKPGTRFVIPVIHTCVEHNDGTPVVFPIEDGKISLSLTKVVASTADGSTMLVGATFSYYVDDPDQFVSEEFELETTPHEMAKIRAKECLTRAVVSLTVGDRPTNNDGLASALARNASFVDAGGRSSKSNLVIEFVSLTHCGLVTDIPFAPTAATRRSAKA